MRTGEIQVRHQEESLKRLYDPGSHYQSVLQGFPEEKLSWRRVSESDLNSVPLEEDGSLDEVHRNTKIITGLISCYSKLTGKPYLQDFAICVKHIHGHFNILLYALSPSLKIPLLQGEVQVIADITCRERSVTYS